MYKNYQTYYSTFNKLGYHTEKKGAEYFFSLLNEVRDLLETGASDEDVLMAMPTLCLEEYHFHLEVGGRIYKEKIKDFLTNRNEKKGKNLLDIDKDLSIEESALLFAKYFEAKEKENAMNKGTSHR